MKATAKRTRKPKRPDPPAIWNECARALAGLDGVELVWTHLNMARGRLVVEVKPTPGMAAVIYRWSKRDLAWLAKYAGKGGA